MRLLRVELTRLRWRRAVVLLVLAGVVLTAVIWAGLAWNTRPVSEAERRAAQEQVEADIAVQAQDPFLQEELQRCVERPEEFGVDPARAEQQCPRIFTPTVEQYLFREPLRVGPERQNTGIAVIAVLVAVAMLIGTTFVGHDWNSGSMSNQLLFEPRRLRVYAAKAGAVFALTLVVAAVVLAAYWSGLWLLTLQRDLSVGEGGWGRVRGTAWRGTVLIGLAGVAGYALTMLFRSTVATLAIMAGVAIAGSLVTVALFGEEGQRWLVPINAMAVILKGYDLRIFDQESCDRTQGRICDRVVEISQYDGALFLGTLLAVSIALSVWTFWRRDVP